MQVFGRRHPRWLVVSAVALCVLALPFILIFGMGLSHAIGSMIGPPSIWARTRDLPANAALAGTYRVEKNTVDKSGSEYTNDRGRSSRAELVLAEDGTMSAHDLPVESTFTRLCFLSGHGTWASTKLQEAGITLYVVSDNSADACADGGYGFAELMGQHFPYTIYWDVGDPDSGAGLELRRR
jgi:hypothetical protein